MKYKYIAVESNGRTKTGVIEACSRSDALDKLRREGLTPLTLKEKSFTIWQRLNEPVVFEKDYSLEQIAALTRSWASLASAGMTIEQSLKVIIESGENAKNGGKLVSILGGVQKGQSLSTALSTTSKAFPVYYIHMVAAGERSGDLAGTMDQLATMLERFLRFRRELISALIYPAILLVAVLVSLMFMVVFVIPQFQEIFAGSGANVPMLTSLVMATGLFLQDQGLVLISVSVVFAAALYFLRQRKEFRLWIGRKILSIDLVVKPFLLSDVMRFMRTLGGLVNGRVPLETAVMLAATTAQNEAIKEDLRTVSQDLKEGRPLSQCLKSFSYFPPICIQLTIIGEQTGQLGPKAEQAASIIEGQLEASLKRATSLLAPVITLVAGAIIGVFVVALLTGILSINDIAL